jgi:hypothetical protein
MSFYYVKSGGTATGDDGRSLTARIGSFAAMGTTAYYPSVKSIFADQVTTGNTIIDGDTIIVANDHLETYSIGTTIGVKNTTNDNVCSIKSVDVNDVSVYLKGAAITVTSGELYLSAKLDRNNYATWFGFVLESTLNRVNPDTDDSIMSFHDCDYIQPLQYLHGVTMNECEYYNCRFYVDSLRVSDTNKFYNCYIKKTASLYFFRSSGGYFEGCDFSDSTGALVVQQGIDIKLVSCLFHDYPFTYSGVRDRSVSALFFNCGTKDEYYSYEGLFYHGNISTNTQVHLNYSYDDINKASTAILSLSTANKGSGLRHKLCELPAQDLSVTDKTYRVNLLLDTDTVATLSDTDFWIEVSHNDNTDLALGKIVSSRNADILAVGTELTTSAELWQGTLPTNTKAYQVDITLSAASLPNVTNGNIVVYVNLVVPNADVYVCPAVQIGV